MTVLNISEIEGVKLVQARHIAGAHMALGSIIRTATRMLEELLAGEIPNADLTGHTVKLSTELAALESIDEIGRILPALRDLRSELEARGSKNWDLSTRYEGLVELLMELDAQTATTIRFMPKLCKRSGEWADAIGGLGMETIDQAEAWADTASYPVRVVRREITEQVVSDNGKE